MPPNRIIIVHTDQNGIGQLIEIAVLKHGTDYGIHCNIKTAA